VSLVADDVALPHIGPNEPYRVAFARRPERPGFAAILPLYVGAALAYYLWRSTIVNWHVWYGPLLYTVEIYGAVATGMYLWMTRHMDLPVHRPVTTMPTVDALIPTLNESREVLEPTVRGAFAIRGIRRVLVLDDGDRDWVRELANAFGAVYIARKSNYDAKAGNLNHALPHTDAELMVLLDADHAPAPHFLERTAGFFDDPTVAFVQTPQTYGNRDTFLFQRTQAGMWSEQGMFYDCIQPCKNHWNSAFFVGTSALLRRSALDGVGGFATGTCTEDIHTSVLLHAQGWRSVFLPEVLAVGLEAENLREFYKQRRRWASGGLVLLLKRPDSPLRIRGLTLVQRLSYFNATSAPAQGAQRLFYFLIPTVCVVTLVNPVNCSLTLFAAAFLSFFALAVRCVAWHARGAYHPLHSETFAMVNIGPHVGAIASLGRRHDVFRTSSKGPQRSARTGMRPLLIALGVVGAVSWLRAAWLLATGSHVGFVAGCFLFINLNLALLLRFLTDVRAYEKGGSSLEALRQLDHWPTSQPETIARRAPRFHSSSSLGLPGCVLCGDRCALG
jgi:cellulose synthase (UDP-forming)